MVFGGQSSSTLSNNSLSGLRITTNASSTGHKLLIGSNGEHGIHVNGAGAIVALQDSSLTENGGHGILIENSQKVELTNVNVLNSGGHGVYVTGNTELTLDEFQINVNDGDGINVNVAADETAMLEVRNANISSNGQSGIEYRSQNAASKLSMANSTVEENDTHGLYIAGKPSAISLGFLEPANNMFRNNGSTYLVDARDANSGPITAYGTNFAGGAIVFFDETGLKNGAASALPRWQIVNVGNSIDFGAAE